MKHVVIEREPVEPHEALAALRRSRRKVLDRTDCPPQWSAVFAGLLSGVVAAQALPTAWFYAVVGVVLLGVLVTALVMRARKGVFVNGWRAGATRGVAMAIFAVYMTIYTTTLWLKIELGVWFAPLIGAAVLFPLAWYGSRRWMQVYRRELAA